MAKKYEKVNFSVGFKSYTSERTFLICLMVIPVLVGLPFILIAFFNPLFGVLPLLIIGFFWYVVSNGLKAIDKGWPVCKKHGLRMDVAGRKPAKNGMELVNFTCPNKDKSVKLLALASSGGRYHGHRGFHGGGFHHGGGGGFGGGRSGGGGAGR
jgi:hypothetical protein